MNGLGSFFRRFAEPKKEIGRRMGARVVYIYGGVYWHSSEDSAVTGGMVSGPLPSQVDNIATFDTGVR